MPSERAKRRRSLAHVGVRVCVRTPRPQDRTAEVGRMQAECQMLHSQPAAVELGAVQAELDASIRAREQNEGMFEQLLEGNARYVLPELSSQLARWCVIPPSTPSMCQRYQYIPQCRQCCQRCQHRLRRENAALSGAFVNQANGGTPDHEQELELLGDLTVRGTGERDSA